jgi:hypothetical protein
VYRIESKIDTGSSEFKENRQQMENLIAELKERVQQVRKGGPPHTHKVHEGRGLCGNA